MLRRLVALPLLLLPCGCPTHKGDTGEVEVCNGRDDDGDGQVDEDVTLVFYRDADGDGFGTSATTVTGCSPPPGYRDVAGDCDDRDPATWPGATEVCDGVDQDCDGAADQDLLEGSWYPDADGDGFGDRNATPFHGCQRESQVADDSDCDDTRVDIHPGALDPLCDGVDQDCDGSGVGSVAVVGDVSYDTLQGAIDAAFAGGLVQVCPGTWSEAGSIASGASTEIASFTGDAEETVLDGGGERRVLDIESGAQVAIRDLTLQHAFYLNSGGAVFASNTNLTLRGARFIENQTREAWSGTTVSYLVTSDDFLSLQVDGCTFEGNRGGAIQVIRNTLRPVVVQISDTVFADNSVDYGGALSFKDSPDRGLQALVEGCTFTGNQAAEGGAIYWYGWSEESLLRIASSTFSGNVAEYGGAISVSSRIGPSTLKFEDVTFEDNVATVSGSVLYENGFSETTTGLSLTVRNSTFRGNLAGSSGPISANGGYFNLEVEGSTFEDNVADYAGVLAAQYVDGDVVFRDTDMWNNQARVGGVLHLVENADMRLLMEGCSIVGNESTQVGGVVHMASGRDEGNTYTFDGTTMERNSTSEGGSVFDGTGVTYGGEVRFTGCTMHENSGGVGAVALVDNFTLVSEGTDWGVDMSENLPCDVVLQPPFETDITSWCEWGADASFTCPGDGTCGE